MSDDTNIVRFPGTEDLPDNLLTIEKSKVMFCNHPSIRLNEHDRTMNCAKCNASLDPFNYLHTNAKHLQSAWDNYRHMQMLASQLQDKVAALKKEEASLRGKVKRMQEKVSPVIDVRGGSKS